MDFYALFLPAAVIATGRLLAYAYRINSLMSAAPVDATYLAGEPLTAETIDATRTRLEKEPIDYERLLPKGKDRRYIIVGGSGMLSIGTWSELLHVFTSHT